MIMMIYDCTPTLGLPSVVYSCIYLNQEPEIARQRCSLDGLEVERPAKPETRQQNAEAGAWIEAAS